MSHPTCALCDERAARKCTRCGNAFCNLHIRYGNPHFALGSTGSVGWYCDSCWEAYEKQGQAGQRIVRTVFIFVLAVFGIMFCLVALMIMGIFVTIAGSILPFLPELF